MIQEATARSSTQVETVALRSIDQLFHILQSVSIVTRLDVKARYDKWYVIDIQCRIDSNEMPRAHGSPRLYCR